MSAIRELIEKWRLASERWTLDDSLRPTLADAAEAELKEREACSQDEETARERDAVLVQLVERDRLLSSTVALHAEALTRLAERDRRDAELLEAIAEWRKSENSDSKIAEWALYGALNRWAAAKGGGK